MKKVVVDSMVNEYSACATSAADPELRLVEAALFVEECFALSLTDDDVTAERLGSPVAIRQFLRERTGT